MKRILFVLLILGAGSDLIFGDEVRPTDAQALLEDAEKDYLEQKFSESAVKLKQALEIFQKQDNRPSMALAAFWLGRSHNAIGKYDEAESALNQALKLHAELKDKKAIGDDLTELAYTARRRGNYDKALELSEQALVIHRETGNQRGILDCYKTIGNVYQFRGDHKKGLEYMQLALDVAVETGDKKGQAQTLVGFGGIQWRLGNLDQALQDYDRALRLAEEIKDRKIQSTTLGNIGLIYWNRGQPREALGYFDRSSAISEQLGDLQVIAINELNVGEILYDLEEYGESQERLQKSLTMSQQIGDKGLQSVALDSLGQVHNALGDQDIALDLTRKAAAIAEEIGEKRTVAYELKHVAAIYAVQGKLTAALESYKKALVVYEELQEKRGIALILNDIAEIHLALKNFNDAMPLYERALLIATELKSSSIEQDTYRGMGWIHYSRKEMESAEEYFTKAVELARETERPDAVWRSLYGRGLVLRDSGNPEQAVTMLEEATGVIEKVRSKVVLSKQKAGYLQEKLDVFEDLIRLLVSSNRPAEAFQYAQRAKARAFLDMLAEAGIDSGKNIDPQLHESKKKLLSELVQTQQKLQAQYEKDTVDTVRVGVLSKKRNELENEFNNLMLKIRKQEPRFAGLQFPQPIGLPEALSLLEEKSILLEYFLGKKGSFLFVIHNDRADAFLLPSETKLAEKVLTLREALSKPEPVWESSDGAHSRYKQLARELFAVLVGPAERELKNNKRIVIAPDGILNYLPFETLLRGAGGAGGQTDFSALPYLGLEFEIQYVPSVSILSVLKANQPANSMYAQKDLIAFADPTDSTARSETRDSPSKYPSVPNARVEVERIAQLFRQDQVLVFEGKEASEQKIKGIQLDEYKRVHFASHGAINEERPWLSALVLSTHDSAEDGFLTMQEVFDLRLNADIVVLSACNTGLGKQTRGEGVMGLSRAFLRAGSSSVLASLWSVSDESTAEFMTVFYRNLKGMTQIKALKEARRQLINGSTYSHPYYWAPFVLIGYSFR